MMTIITSGRPSGRDNLDNNLAACEVTTLTVLIVLVVINTTATTMDIRDIHITLALVQKRRESIRNRVMGPITMGVMVAIMIIKVEGVTITAIMNIVKLKIAAVKLKIVVVKLKLTTRRL